MERMTIRNSDGSVSQPTDLKWADALERLAAYEDTGLEPEELRKILDSPTGAIAGEIAEVTGSADVARASEIAKAEAEGRLLVLPCKVGDVLHRIYSMNHIEEDRAMGFLVTASGVWYWNEDYRETPIEKIGKTVFLTREEAEAALRGGADNA